MSPELSILILIFIKIKILEVYISKGEVTRTGPLGGARQKNNV